MNNITSVCSVNERTLPNSVHYTIFILLYYFLSTSWLPRNDDPPAYYILPCAFSNENM